MNDYTLNKNQKSSFILNYTILKKSNYIRIYYASGDSNLVPYSTKNEKKILEAMKQQVINSNAYVDKEEIKSFFAKMGAFLVGAGTVAFNAVLIKEGIDPDALCGNIPFLAAELGILYKNRKYKANVENVKMHKTFIEYEERINNYLKVTYNILSGTSDKTKFILNNPAKDLSEFYEFRDIYKNVLYTDNPYFNINSIGNVPIDDFYKIIENLKREEKLNFDYSEKALRK